jgi:hypothetical protein
MTRRCLTYSLKFCWVAPLLTSCALAQQQGGVSVSPSLQHHVLVDDDAAVEPATTGNAALRGRSLAVLSSAILSSGSDKNSSNDNPACFTDCVIYKMTGEECKQFIHETLVKKYEVPSVELVPIAFQMVTQDPKLAGASTIGQVENNDVMSTAPETGVIRIPSNLEGKVTACDPSGGDKHHIISHALKWEVMEENEKIVSYDLPDVNCKGLQPAACCEKVMSTYTGFHIPLTDKNGICMSCSFEQALVEAKFVKDQDQEGQDADEKFKLIYQDHDADCNIVERSVRKVHQEVFSMKSMVQYFLTNQIETVLATGATCSQLFLLQKDLMTYTRTISTAHFFARDLLCGICHIGAQLWFSAALLPSHLVADLETIQEVMLQPEASQMVKQLAIQTNADGKVIEVPTLGGNDVQCSRL